MHAETQTLQKVYKTALNKLLIKINTRYRKRALQICMIFTSQVSKKYGGTFKAIQG